jgi:hypothetical protein
LLDALHSRDFLELPNCPKFLKFWMGAPEWYSEVQSTRFFLNFHLSSELLKWIQPSCRITKGNFWLQGHENEGNELI